MSRVNTAGTLEITGAKPRREPLTRDRIIRTAVRIMDEEGLEAVSMRRIGRELGVEAMSLYNHVEDKEDILDSICEVVVSDFRIPDADGWNEAARLAAREYRRLLLAHPSASDPSRRPPRCAHTSSPSRRFGRPDSPKPTR